MFQPGIYIIDYNLQNQSFATEMFPKGTVRKGACPAEYHTRSDIIMYFNWF